MQDKERTARIIQLHMEGNGAKTIADTIRSEGKPIGSTTVYSILRSLGLIPEKKVEESESIVSTGEEILIDESTPDLAALAAEPDEPDEPDELSYQEIADSRKSNEFIEPEYDINQFTIDNFIKYVNELISPIEHGYIKLGESIDKIREKVGDIEELAVTIASQVSEVDVLRSTLSDYQKRIEELQEKVDAFQKQSLSRAMVVHGEGSLTESPPRRGK